MVHAMSEASKEFLRRQRRQDKQVMALLVGVGLMLAACLGAAVIGVITLIRT